ncbi:unnamed protein product [Polarella glacialis]|uniref:Reverse transcriptase domain-containing protein n=1 Tax=Polarella glacialis TaxID=89957 RepID=A0A813I8J1_POLGL|nr:unnamed protein product [Polarella glacialis]
MTLLWEVTNEHQLPLFVAAVDFEKAFDTVGHSSIWEALREQGVRNSYVQTLERLYSNQSGQVLTEVLSPKFPVERGTKQGDPISPVLFNAVLEKAMRKARQRWDEKGYGIEVEQGRLLQNLRFADDVLLVASSLHDLREMLGDLMEVAKEVGLEMHLGKTKILANSIGQEQRRTRTTVSVQNREVEFLALGDNTMYLGRSLTLGDYHGTEIQHRISKGWNKFWSLKKTLCDRSHSLKARLKLFDATITPAVLYGSCSWTMTAARERMLQTAQRRMLRKFVGSNRRIVPIEAEEDGASSVSSPADSGLIDFNNDEEDQEQLEPWLDWIKRLTHTAEDQMRMEGIDDWVRQQRRRKWQWAGHAARRTDGRWSTTIIHWTPTDGRRRVGHPGKRWIDCIDHVMSRCSNVGRGDWFLLAQDKPTWKQYESNYVNIFV